MRGKLQQIEIASKKFMKDCVIHCDINYLNCNVIQKMIKILKERFLFQSHEVITKVCNCMIQVPQYILEHAEKTGRGCRVICSMPRRISAVAISERVAAERGEHLASVVGYQVHAECRLATSPCLR